MALDRPRVQGEIRVDVPFWLPFHEKLVAKAQSNVSETCISILLMICLHKMMCQMSVIFLQTAQTCFFGDSITESLQGTQAGKDCSWCLKGKNALKDIYGDEVLVLGISGDQSRHLLWRVSHGEISQSCKKAFVLIGTNDLGYAAAKARENGLNMESSIKEARDSAIQGMEAVARSLHRYNMHIIMVGILPRNPSVFRETIDEINEYFR